MEIRDALQQVALEWPCYGYRRITAELQRRGFEINHKRVLRLMRMDNLLCLRRKQFVLTTESNHDLPVYPNLARDIKPTGIDQLWVADITYFGCVPSSYISLSCWTHFQGVSWAGLWAVRWKRNCRWPPCRWLWPSGRQGRPDPSLRPRSAVCFPRVHGSTAGAQDSHQHEPERQLPTGVHAGLPAHGLLQPARHHFRNGRRWGLPVLAWSFHACLGSQPAQSPADACDDAPAGFAFRHAERRRLSGRDYFAAQYPVCTCPCQRFNGSLAAGHA
jgi:hypothetical protein